MNCLNLVLDSLLLQYRSGVIDIHEPIVKVTEALEHLEEMLGPVQFDAILEWNAAKNRVR